MLLHRIASFIALLMIFSACAGRSSQLISVQLTDQNGLKETFSSKDRLEAYTKKDYLSPQPYKKILRVYRGEEGSGTSSLLTSYYPNGQIEKFLEIRNTQAHGLYREWHQNGALRVEARVISGSPDFTTSSESTWLFDGLCQAWGEDGSEKANIHYKMGDLDGKYTTYHANGCTWKSQTYSGGKLQGESQTYCFNGNLLEKTHYSLGRKSGESLRYWDEDHLAAKEFFIDGKLSEGSYYSPNGKLISKVTKGNGQAARFRKNSLYMLEEIKEGLSSGEIKIYDRNNKICRSYSHDNGIKEGPEIVYYENGAKKMEVQWRGGAVTGVVKTWYPNNTLESQREFSYNSRSGILTCWYIDGATMLVEKYKNDKLVDGEYFSPNELRPVSKIQSGSGIATIYDSNGNYLREVIYQGGQPVIE